MPDLEPSRSVPTAPPAQNRPSIARAQSSTANGRPPSNHAVSAQSLDDASTYNRGDHDSLYRDGEDETEEDYISEKMRQEDDEEAAAYGEDQVPEVQMGISDVREVDAHTLEKKKSTRSIKDPNLVTWDGPNDPDNPKNWAFRTRWAATIVVSSFAFISPVSSTMVSPALSAIAREFNVANDVVSQLVLSIFILGYAVGPLFLGPLSEMYGRVPVLQLANMWYLVFNLACGGSRNAGELIAFRFLSGLGGSAPMAVGGGVLSDCWRAEERGRAISIYSLAPLLGPALGPIAGGFITENTTWRWTFWATSIADGLIQVSGLMFLKETYPPKLLHKKAERLRKETGNTALHTEFEKSQRSLTEHLKRSFVRPFKLLGTQIIVQTLAIYMAYLFGLIYLVLSTFAGLWETRYHESSGISGLNYIAQGVGYFLGTQISAPLNDRTYRYLKKRNGGVGRPEYRIPLIVPCSIMVPVGLFIYGWTAEYRTHWIGPDIGTAIFSAGTITSFQCIQSYLIDAYPRYAASAIAAASVLRSCAGCAFPLFAPYMYNALGIGWGNSLLAFVALGLGLPAPWLLWYYGQKLRERSPFAAGGD